MEMSFQEIKIHYLIENPERDFVRYYGEGEVLYSNAERMETWDYLRSQHRAEIASRLTAPPEPLPQHLWPQGCWIYQKAKPHDPYPTD